MRSTIIPAQVTTVEDKIAGNLGVTQLLLLTAPIFGGSALFVVFPPFFGYAVYKVVLIVCLMVLSGMLAIRIKGRIVLHWLIILSGYMMRPKYYVFDKNDNYLRASDAPAAPDAVAAEEAPTTSRREALPLLAPAELVRLDGLIADPRAQLQFKTNRKGELSVYVTEVQ